MTIWRNSGLEGVFGGPLDSTGITTASVARIVSDAVSESEQLDFKSHLWGHGPTAGWTHDQEFAKDVAALANHRGGILLAGIAEKGRRCNQTRTDQCLHLTRAARATLAPSTRSVSDTAGANRVRLGRCPPSRVLPRRGRAREPFGAHGIWAYGYSVPETVVPGRLDREMVEQVRQWHGQHYSISPLGRTLQAHGRPIAAPGRVTFGGSLRTIREDPTDIRDAYAALYLDGSAFVATPVSLNADDGVAVNKIADLSLVDDSFLLIDTAVRWSTFRVGSFGTSTVALGLIDADSSSGEIATPGELVSGFGFRRISETREVVGRPLATTLADLGSVDTMQQRLVVGYSAIAGPLSTSGSRNRTSYVTTEVSDPGNTKPT